MKTFHKILIVLNFLLAIAMIVFAVSLFDQREIFKQRILTLESHAKTMSNTLEWGEFAVHEDQTRPERFGAWPAEELAEAEQMRTQIQHHDRMHIGLSQLEEVAADRFATLIANKEGWDATENKLGETDAVLASTRIALETLQAEHKAALLAHEETKDQLARKRQTIVALQGELLQRDQVIAERDDLVTDQQLIIAQRDIDLETCNKEWRYQKEQAILCCSGVIVPSEDLEATVVATEAELNFVVLDVGARQKVKENGTALIHRDGELVGKIAISRVNQNTSIGQILNDWTIENMTIQTGDEVLF